MLGGPQEVWVETPPGDKGFSLLGPQDAIVLAPGDYADLAVAWAPSEAGGAREILKFFTKGAGHLLVVLHGLALSGGRAFLRLWTDLMIEWML